MDEIDKVKMVIVIRKDLNMRKGKIVAQAGHAMIGVLLEEREIFSRITPYAENNQKNILIAEINADTKYWLEHDFFKICLYCENEEELNELYNLAIFADLPAKMIVDRGHTEFHGIETKTCIAIGPAKSSVIDLITGHLKLL